MRVEPIRGVMWIRILIRTNPYPHDRRVVASAIKYHLTMFCCYMYASNPPTKGLDSSVVNLNCLLVKRQNDNPSPGADSLTGGKSVPSSHKRGELKSCTLSSDSSQEEIRDSGRSFQPQGGGLLQKFYDRGVRAEP